LAASHIDSPLTVREVVTEAAARFKRARLSFGHGTTNAWDEAVYLVLHALREPLDRLAPLLERPLTAAEGKRVERLVAGRIGDRQPAAYLTREAWLGDHRFYVDRRVLIPRSFIAELLRERLRPWIMRPARVKRVLDLCTGSGCLAILAALAFPRARVDAADISLRALQVARRNIAAYRLSRRIRLVRSDVFRALAGQRYDLIISNPPYVADAAMRRLPMEYRCEPGLALHGGVDGLAFVRRILGEAGAHLARRGLLVMETGHNRPVVERAFPRLPFIWPETSGGDDCVLVLERQELDAAFPLVHPASPAASGSPLA
jgi:ribosomal protein L3 glutamine methyltransferase